MIIADAGPMIASLARADSHHARVVAFLHSNKEPLVIPSTILAEVSHFLMRYGLVSEEARLLRSIGTQRLQLEDPTLPDYLRAADLVEQYGDFPLGTVDAVIVAMAERLNVRTILTLDDRHFRAVKPRHCERFQLAP